MVPCFSFVNACCLASCTCVFVAVGASIDWSNQNDRSIDQRLRVHVHLYKKAPSFVEKERSKRAEGGVSLHGATDRAVDFHRSYFSK
mmetsp:Transcript_14971/g.30262  ORF Transcript_14971/g.30262 Transcript_14971/m.30262 type:complete len:87 (+) Transcript_14971:754-1014(+)